jgi:hypothetical protein
MPLRLDYMAGGKPTAVRMATYLQQPPHGNVRRRLPDTDLRGRRASGCRARAPAVAAHRPPRPPGWLRRRRRQQRWQLPRTSPSHVAVEPRRAGGHRARVAAHARLCPSSVAPVWGAGGLSDGAGALLPRRRTIPWRAGAARDAGTVRRGGRIDPGFRIAPRPPGRPRRPAAISQLGDKTGEARHVKGRLQGSRRASSPICRRVRAKSHQVLLQTDRQTDSISCSSGLQAAIAASAKLTSAASSAFHFASRILCNGHVRRLFNTRPPSGYVARHLSVTWPLSGRALSTASWKPPKPPELEPSLSPASAMAHGPTGHLCRDSSAALATRYDD